jgi:glyoxalase family protein
MVTVDDTPGVHHVTGIVGDAQATVDFYAGTLGMRFVKRTVDFEDRFAYHLYFGDETGAVGSVLTFFPFPGEVPGRVGTPQIATASLAVPPESLDYWQDRFAERAVEHDQPTERFGERVLPFRDPEGTHLELVATDGPTEPWTGGEVPTEHAVRGVHGVAVQSASPYVTASLLETFGLELAAETDRRARYRAPERGSVVDVRLEGAEFGREGAGSLHHVALGVESETALHEWRDLLADREDCRVSRVTDRHFFDSLYVRDGGGILFELATEPTDLTHDDPAPGEHLYLPPRFEEDRAVIERQLPELTLPE